MYFIEHSGKHPMLKAILFSKEVCFFTEVEQVYHDFFCMPPTPSSELVHLGIAAVSKSRRWKAA